MFRKELDERSERRWKIATGDKNKTPLRAHCIVMVREGVAAEVHFPPGWKMREMYDVPCSAPHITLSVGRGYRARQMGQVMTKALFAERRDTDIADLQMDQVDEDTLYWIKHKSELWGQPMIVEIADTPQDDNMFKVEYGYRCWTLDYPKPCTNDDPDWERFTEHEKKNWMMWKDSNCSRQSLMAVIEEELDPVEKALQAVPSEVLAETVSPCELKLKPEAKLSHQRQYHISPEAAEGMQETTEELLTARINEEVPGVKCSILVFPVLKADKVRWRTFQELRPVNAIEEDWPADRIEDRMETVHLIKAPCYQEVEALYLVYCKALIGWPVTIFSSHAVVHLIEQGRFCLTPQRQMKYFDLVFCSDVTISMCDQACNPASCISLECEDEPHECVADAITFSKLRADLASESLGQGERVLFVNGSSHNHDNKTHGAVKILDTGQLNTWLCIPCCQPCSTQLAEHQALTEACLIATDEGITNYTDSPYAHNVCHLRGAQWKQRGFKKPDGSPIQHLDQIQLFLAILMCPEKIAIYKCKAHKRDQNSITLGNARVNEVVKEAALQARGLVQQPRENGMHVMLISCNNIPLHDDNSPDSMPCPTACPYSQDLLYDFRWYSVPDGPDHFHHLDPLCCTECQRAGCHLCGKLPCVLLSKHALMSPMITLQPQTTIQDIIQLQHDAGPYEHSKWSERGANKGQDRVLRTHAGHMIAPTELLHLLVSDAHDLDHCARGEVKRKICNENFWLPHMQDVIDEKMAVCRVCSLHNVKHGTATRLMGHIPRPEGPFKHLVIDYINMTKRVGDYRYIFVVISKLSRWLEACPTPGQEANTVIKFVMREIISRFLDIISSDNGKAHTESTWERILHLFWVQRRLRCVNHPQSQGVMERANRTLKDKFTKIYAETSTNWVDVLSIALIQMRSQQNFITTSTLYLTTKAPELSSEPQKEKCWPRAWSPSLCRATKAPRPISEAQTKRTHLMSSNAVKPVVQIPAQVSPSRVQNNLKQSISLTILSSSINVGVDTKEIDHSKEDVCPEGEGGGDTQDNQAWKKRKKKKKKDELIWPTWRD